MSQVLQPIAARASFIHTLRAHWPEYLIEGWALGMFMLSAAVFSTVFGYPGSRALMIIADADMRRVLVGVAMGLTAVALIYSPWGKRSGAHMNPAVTLTFLRLGKIAPLDALLYIGAQFVGGALGVLVAVVLLHDAFAAAPVSYAITMPGSQGVAIAWGCELAISAVLMFVVLAVSNTHRVAHLTGLFAGILVATYISLEAPLSGMSMNPARSFASAFPGHRWEHLWIYFTAPVLGMQLGATIYLWLRGRRAVGCAKLIHATDQRCIHCGYQPPDPAKELQ